MQQSMWLGMDGEIETKALYKSPETAILLPLPCLSMLPIMSDIAALVHYLYDFMCIYWPREWLATHA